MPAWLRQHWFVVGMLLTLVGSWWLPGPAADANWPDSVKLGLIAAIFLCSGLALRSEELGRGVGAWRLHLMIQGFAFVVTPLTCLALDQLWRWCGVDASLRLGLLVLGALPTTVTSCVVLTMAVDGNRAAALINATLGNLLGVVITPLWLVAITNTQQASLDIGSVMQKLGLVVVLPVIAGQLLRRPLRQRLTAATSKQLGQLSLALLLGVLWLVFARAADHRPDPATLAVCLGIVCLLHAVWLWLPWWLSQRPRLDFSPSDRRCVLFCASQKTLALGLPLIALCFAGHPAMATISLPILCYHPLQLLVAALLVPRLKPA